MVSYSTQKLFERLSYKNEDTLAHTKDDTIFGIDEDEQGKYVKVKSGDSQHEIRIEGNAFVFYKDGVLYKKCNMENALAFAMAIQYLANAVESTKDEDGTAADLGAIPTGHISHSLDMDENDTDDGW